MDCSCEGVSVCQLISPKFKTRERPNSRGGSLIVAANCEKEERDELKTVVEYIINYNKIQMC
jgi:hypothetical protein